jgi:putative phosphoribosyl transferase
MAVVEMPAGEATLEGELIVPVGARGLVLFAHGSGSSRHSPRNKLVAASLQQGRLGTLLIDLLTADEEVVDQRTAHLRFDIGLLARRLAGATDWLADNDETSHLRLGYFGASTGAAAALIAATERPEKVQAVVSRGGRPDLAGEALARVAAPTLLLVGSLDPVVVKLNRTAFDRLNGEKRLEILPGATHLFEEPGALERVGELAREWFQLHLAGRTMPAHP